MSLHEVLFNVQFVVYKKKQVMLQLVHKFKCLVLISFAFSSNHESYNFTMCKVPSEAMVIIFLINSCSFQLITHHVKSCILSLAPICCVPLQISKLCRAQYSALSLSQALLGPLALRFLLVRVLDSLADIRLVFPSSRPVTSV